MTFGRDKRKETSAIPPAQPPVQQVQPKQAIEMPGTGRPRPILEEMRRIRRAKQEQVAKARSLVNTLIQDIGSLEKELSMCRFDEQYVEDHPQIEDIFSPDFLARFAGKTQNGEEENHGQSQEKEQRQEGQAGAGKSK